MELVKVHPGIVYRGNGIGKKKSSTFKWFFISGFILARRTRYEEQTLTKVEAKH